MGRYVDKDSWEEEILIPDTHTPILGGQPVWEGDRLVDGFANVSSAILADRTRHLKNKIDGIEIGLDSNFENFMKKEDNLSDLEDIQQAKYNLELNLVDNTRDSDKPVSTAQQAALDLKLNADDNAVSASKLATPRTINLSGDASGSTSFDGSANATIVVQVADDSHNHVISNVDGLQSELDSKVDKVVGKQLSDENYTLVEKDKLAGVAVGATKNATDAQLRDRTTHTGVQPISTVSGLQSELDSKVDTTYVNNQLATKVDKVVGKELSTNDFTNQLRDKLASLESSHFRGTFTSKGDLEFAIPTAEAGDYADVDVAGQDAERYIWDSSDSIWVLSTTKPAPLTAAQIKQMYESNPDTKPFDDAAEAKLEGIADGATKNATDAQLRARATHTGTQPISTISGLEAELTDKVSVSDSRLTNSREWTAGTVSQAEAEAGTATTRRAWTALRVRQAVVSWWDSSAFKTKLDGIATGATKNATDAQLRSRATHTGVQPISSVTNLQSSLDSKVDKQSGYGLSQENYTPAEKAKLAVLEEPHFKGVFPSLTALQAAVPSPVAGNYAQVGSEGNPSVTYSWDVNLGVWVEQDVGVSATEVKSLYESNPNTNAFTDSEKTKLSGIQAGATTNATNAQLRDRTTHTGVQPISSVSGLQAGLDNKVDKTISVVAGTGLSGGGTLSANRTLNVQYGTTAGTATQGNDSRIVNAVPNTRQIIAGTGLSGGGTLAANRTLSVNYGTTAGTAAQGNDSRLSNSREWTATTVSQAEAQAGTATTRRAWTAQRVRQAILGWWNASAEKTKLDGIQAGAQVNSVASVAGRTGAVVVTKADVGLSNVSNTSDAAKPVSTAQQAALNLKLNANANAVSATRLQTARTINGESFDGTANITIPTGITADEWYLGTDKQQSTFATGATVLDLSAASIFDLTLTGNVTLTVSNVTAPAGETRSIVVRIRQEGTARTVTWWENITWLSPTTPPAPGTNKLKEYILSYDGVEWIGREGASN